MVGISQKGWVRLKANVYMVLKGFPSIYQRPSWPCHDMNTRHCRQDLPQHQSGHEQLSNIAMQPESGAVLGPGPSRLSFSDVQTGWMPENRGRRRGLHWPTNTIRPPSGFYSPFAIRLGLLLLEIRLIPARVRYTLKRKYKGRPSSSPVGSNVKDHCLTEEPPLQ